MTEQTAMITDQQARLMEMSGGFIAIWDGYVNMADLEKLRPGGFVRCRKSPSECISTVHPDLSSVGCVAGWISDEQ